MSAWSCTIDPPPNEIPALVNNTCDKDGQCGEGFCDLEVARCVAPSSDFTAILLEIVPPANNEQYGARQFFQRIGGLQNSTDLEVVVQRPRVVPGRARLWLDNCLGHVIVVTLTPRLGSLGVPVERYFAESRSDLPEEFPTISDPLIINAFDLANVPPGSYDLYWEDKNFGTSCGPPAVPQVVRAFQVLDGPNSTTLFDQTEPEPRPLEVSVPWHPDLEGFIVDVVHNITGERISSQGVLTQDGVDDSEGEERARAEIRLSAVRGTDYALPSFPAGAFVRLRPPLCAEEDDACFGRESRPTVFLGLSGIEFQEGFARVGVSLGPFRDLVRYEAWVWEEGDSTRPVSGSARFTATQLTDIPDGVLVSFSRTAEVDDAGRIRVDLPPGIYTVDVTPARSTGLGRYRTSVRVWAVPPDADAGATQAGQLIALPPPPRLSGRLRSPAGKNPVGAVLRVSPSVSGGLGATTRQRRLLPRSDTHVIAEDGRFDAPLDCAWCSTESTTSLDFVFQPPEGSGLPWSVYHGVDVSADIDLGTISLRFPRLHRGQLSFRGSETAVPAPFPGPLIRAYAMLDRDGVAVSDVALPLCVDVPPAAADEAAVPCIQKAVLVAETRADAEGRFELLLPQSFQTIE